MYPILKNGVSYGSFSYNDEPADVIHYFIGDPYDSENNYVEISPHLYHKLVNGDNPTNCRNKYDKYSLYLLEQYGMLQTTRLVKSGLIDQYILFIVNKISRRTYNICKIVNALLPYISCVSFIIGLLLKGFKPDYTYDFNILLYILLSFSSIFLHECGHIIAGISYKYQVRDCGLLLLFGILPIGAYISTGEKEHPKKKEELQLYLAGIETNILIAGMCIIIGAFFPSLSFTMYAVAELNTILATINILPASILKLDGYHVLKALLGIEEFGPFFKWCVFNRHKRREILKAGIYGRIAFLILALPIFSDIFLVCLFGHNIISVLRSACNFISSFF